MTTSFQGLHVNPRLPMRVPSLDVAAANCREIAVDPIRLCSSCSATTVERFWGPMMLIEKGAARSVMMCPVGAEAR